ncbi:MAG: Bug family tripartite tricarboxylate transporter substrate binding protein [Gemmatimonas sp.]
MPGTYRAETRRRWIAAGGVLAFALIATDGHAESAADFYRNKKIELMIGYDPGASYDAYGRLLARHLGNHVPGNPAVVAMNKPGAGSLVAANAIYQDARKDGTVVGIVGQSLYFMQIVGQPNIRYDAPKFTWIGRMTNVTDLVISWHEADAKTFADLKTTKTTVAVGGAVSGSTLYVNFMNAMLGTRFEPIKGYDGNAPMLAMERREIDATGSVNWFGLQASRPQWIAEKKINILVQIGLQKAKGLEDVPLLPDLATNDRDRKILVALAATDEIGRSVLAPPDIPKDRAEALRRAFDATMQSPEFLAEAGKARLAINPMNGEELARLVVDSGSGLTPDMVAQIKTMSGL